jgi:hypothetical protein
MTDKLPILPTPQEVRNLTAKEAAALVKPASVFGEVAGVDQPTIPTGSPRDLLINLIERALRSEAGVREQQAHHKPTGYYTGRKAGFVCSAATLVAMLYGADYEAAKAVVSREVGAAGELVPTGDLRGGRGYQLAEDIATKAIESR